MKKLSLALALCLLLAPASTATAQSLDTASSWARDHITAALEKGFIPADIQNNYTAVITRAEFCRMAVLWVEYAYGIGIDDVLNAHGLARKPNAFTDTADSDILAAYALGITRGMGGGLFNPGGLFNREQAATMVMNTCVAIGANVGNPPMAGFDDMNEAAGWAHLGINFVLTNGIMSGMGNNTFAPQGLYTREQSIATFNNIRLMSASEQADGPADASAFEQEVLKLTNIERANYGLAPLQWHEVLGKLSRAYSADMSARDFFGHICPDGSNPFDRMNNAVITYRAAAENVAFGYRTPADVVKGWMDSPGHRQNILNPSLTHIGIGFYNYYWTQKFIGLQ
jgi:uncharacterized protein YkwD